MHLVAGGTLANLLVISSILKPYESVVAANTGHIYTNEAGAIESSGHKVEGVQTVDGKLTAADIFPLLDKQPRGHKVKPRVVYISNSTETGVIYTKAELKALSSFCAENKLILYMDGARLPCALTATDNDLSLEDVADLTDVFYIGGTKCGALLGEAIVITREELKADFIFHVKQKGGLMAKGMLLGLQFSVLMRDDLIFRLAAHANATASKIAETIKSLNYPWLNPPASNQLFPILPNALIKELLEHYEFYPWKIIDPHHTAARLITSWATPEDQVDRFIQTIRKLS